MKRPIVLSATLTLAYLALAFIPSNLQAGWTRTYPGGEGYCVQQTADGGYIITGSLCALLKVDSSGDTLWSRKYLGSYFCVQETSDGGYMIIGMRGTGWLGHNLCLIKTDAEGDSLWVFRLGSKSHSSGHGVVETADGGYMATGSPWSLIRLDSDGDTLWTRLYGYGMGSCIQRTSDDGYVVTGIAWDVEAETEDVWLLKTDEDGDSTWTQTYDMGEVFYESGSCVRQTSDGGYIMTGWSGQYLWLMKTDDEGETVWSFEYGQAKGESVCESNDGGYVVTGKTSLHGNSDLLLFKTNSEGEILWTRVYGGEGIDAGHSVQQATDGGYIVTGYTASFGGGVWLLKTDSLGDTLEAAVAEQLVADYPGFEILSPIGHQITLHYSNHLSGFHAEVYDALGRKMDVISAAGTSGTITWGQGHTPGVYFIRPVSDNSQTIRKVVLVR